MLCASMLYASTQALHLRLELNNSLHKTLPQNIQNWLNHFENSYGFLTEDEALDKKINLLKKDLYAHPIFT